MAQQGSKIYPVILSGGVGQRLWPLSRTDFPKQFQSLSSDQSMIIETAERVQNTELFQRITVVCNSAHRFFVAAHFQERGIKPRSIILETAPRNTGPAIAAATMDIYKDDPNALILVLPSDHYIKDTEAFEESIKTLTPIVSQGYLSTLGVTPTYPETGYGYIKHGQRMAGSNNIYHVEHFAEKPDRITAEGFIETGKYTWNAGIFFCHAGTVIDEMKIHYPRIHQTVLKSVTDKYKDLDFTRLSDDFLNAPDISFDVAIMEQTNKAIVMPVSLSWNDIGSWGSLWDVEDKDEQLNVCVGDVVAYNTKNSYLRSTDRRLLATVGLDNVVIVSSEDAVLVANRNNTQEVKTLLEHIKSQGQGQFLKGRMKRQPWGYSRLLQEGCNYTSKEVMIKPGYETATQVHFKKSEHWVILEGEAEIKINGVTSTLSEGQSTYIPERTEHSLKNNRDKNLVIYEVQCGEIDDTDIIRIQDSVSKYIKNITPSSNG